MRSDKRKYVAVVELALVPARVVGAMALLAVRGETCGSMVGLLCCVIVGFVTAVASLRCAGELSVFVARGTVHRCVSAHQREYGTVIELALMPAGICKFVADFARCRESRVAMIRLLCAVIVCFVAAVAVSRCSCKNVVFVAGLATRRCVNSRKRENIVVIELGLPVQVCRAVAGFAIRGKS